MTKRQKKLVKKCYEKILDKADEIDDILEGTAFRDEIYELIDKQQRAFEIVK